MLDLNVVSGILLANGRSLIIVSLPARNGHETQRLPLPLDHARFWEERQRHATWLHAVKEQWARLNSWSWMQPEASSMVSSLAFPDDSSK